jgi:hypothetical protein
MYLGVFDNSKMKPIADCRKGDESQEPGSEFLVAGSDGPLLLDAPEFLMVRRRISSNEPDAANGDGNDVGDVDGEDGYSAPVEIDLTYNPTTETCDGTTLLRAERDGAAGGRGRPRLFHHRRRRRPGGECFNSELRRRRASRSKKEVKRIATARVPLAEDSL